MLRWVIALVALTLLASAISLPGSGSTLTIIYTADTQGFLQSCGCTTAQVGGLAKRATLLRQLQHKSPGALLIDGGNLAGDLRRAEAVMQCLRLMHYHAVGIGELDLKLGAGYWKQARACGLPLTACPAPTRNTSQYAAPYITARIDGRSIVVVGLSPRAKSAGKKAATGRDGNPDEGEAQIIRILSSLRQRANMVIVMSPLTFDEERELVLKLEGARKGGERPLVDLVIGMRSHATREPISLHGVTFVPVPQKGEVGVVEASFVQSHSSSREQVSFRHHFEVVTDSLPADREVQEVVSAYYARQAAELLEANMSRAMDWTKLGYETSHSCAECHAREVELWQRTKHAHAAETLKAKNRLVGECLTCHSELFRRTKKFNPELGVAWHGVECSTCHGDGVLHSALGVRQHIARKVDERLCRTCHNPENDPKFEPVSYLERIRHWQ